MRVAADPGLYRPDDEVPSLCGTRCASCGRVSFPPLSIGCDVCGALEAQLEPVDLAARGVVHSVVAVHLHHGDVEAPFTIGEILLDSGPLVRAVVSGSLAIGEPVSAAWTVVRVDENGDDIVEPVFATVRATAGQV